MNQRAEEVWDKAVANWSEHFRKQRKIGPTTATEADDIIVETIAAALAQTKREGIEAMRDALLEEPWIWNQDDQCIDIANKLLAQTQEEE